MARYEEIIKIENKVDEEKKKDSKKKEEK
jgi:hypothetical protein